MNRLPAVWRLLRKWPVPMPSGFDNHKGFTQIARLIAFQHDPERFVHGVHRSRGHAQVQDAGTFSSDEYQAAEVPIAGHEDATPFLGECQQNGIIDSPM